MAGGSNDHNNCDLCGLSVPVTQQRCAPCIANKATVRVNATWYPTFDDERTKKNGKS
jgi:hypothetical protein